jgi:hypothetical protein
MLQRMERRLPNSFRARFEARISKYLSSNGKQGEVNWEVLFLLWNLLSSLQQLAVAAELIVWVQMFNFLLIYCSVFTGVKC